MSDRLALPPNRAALLGIAAAMGGGAILIIAFSFSAASLSSILVSACVGVLLAGACVMVGGLLGFLFGIPKSLQGSNDLGNTAPHSLIDSESRNRRSVTYGANTNLEQISDWLTKILVGVGLTQLTAFPKDLQSLAAYLAPAFGSSPYPQVMAIAIVLHFSISGFLFGFLWTRLFLGEALREADVAALGEKLGELEQQMSTDAKALSLTQRQLNPPTNAPDVPQSELQDAIVASSRSAKTTIYYQAWDMRSRNWSVDKSKMERVIPVFRALAASDFRDEYHANHGQLGFALKDKPSPDWVEAEKELSKAIAIRGDWKEHGWLFYEFNRAVCLIHIQKSLPASDPQVNQLRERIRSDLRAAASHEEIREMIIGENLDAAIIREWLTDNGLDVNTL